MNITTPETNWLNLLFQSSGDRELGQVTYARNHGFAAMDCQPDVQMETTDEPKPGAPVKGPEWLPPSGWAHIWAIYSNIHII